MKPKQIFRLAATIAAVALMGAAYVIWYPYRYGRGRVWLENNPNAVWNGLLPAPVFQFRVPPFVRPRYWKPAPEQIREALRSSPHLSQGEIATIVQACVSVEEQDRNSEPSGAANRGQPVRAETNQT